MGGKVLLGTIDFFVVFLFSIFRAVVPRSIDQRSTSGVPNRKTPNEIAATSGIISFAPECFERKAT